MNSKRLLTLAVGLILLFVAARQELALSPSWQDNMVLAGQLLIALASLAAFTAELRWSWIILWMAAVAVNDISLLIRPPMPSFLIRMYTFLAVMAALLYLSVRDANIADLKDGWRRLLDSPELKTYRALLLILLPFWAAAVVLAKTGSEAASPVYPRSIHPAPPDSSDFKGKSYAMATLENPYRKLEKEDPVKFAEAVLAGKKVYYQNCYYCHGDHLDGKGPAATALIPRPANFQDPGTIAMLQESFVFWRISKGGPGMPSSGHPWNSAMPQWEKMLSEDEIWKVVLWLYSYTNQSPRTWAHDGAEAH